MSVSWPTVSLQSLICHMCSLRTETWRRRSMMSISTAGAISSRPPRRTRAMRGKWVWQRRAAELMATLSSISLRSVVMTKWNIMNKCYSIWTIISHYFMISNNIILLVSNTIMLCTEVVIYLLYWTDWITKFILK